MNIPTVISEDSFQFAWAQALNMLQQSKWNLWNLVVQVKNPLLFDEGTHVLFETHAQEHNMIMPNQVAYTIFPIRAYHPGETSRERLYNVYWRFFERSRKSKHHRWGAYFERMIRYPHGNEENIDQLGNIIDNINAREKNHGAANVMVIPIPKRDINKTMGAPCLNYVTVQTENQAGSSKLLINLLAVYRNHDFSERAYGNYYGLCNLLKYIAYETNSDPGCLTCVSSHAYANKHLTGLRELSRCVIEDYA